MSRASNNSAGAHRTGTFATGLVRRPSRAGTDEDAGVAGDAEEPELEVEAVVTVVGVVRTTAAAEAMEAGTGMGMGTGMGTATTRNLLRYSPFAGPG